MRDMADSVCLIKLYQITMRKKFYFLFLTTLSVDFIGFMFFQLETLTGLKNSRSPKEDPNLMPQKLKDPNEN